MQWMLLISSLLPGVLIVLIGSYWKRYPPKKINHLYGYRTKKSMKNMDTWNYANKIGAKMFINGGVILVVLGGITYLLDPLMSIWVITIATVIVLLGGIVFCEQELSRVFDKKGNRKGQA